MQNRAFILKLFSAFALCFAWEIAGRVPVSYAFPTFLESMSALMQMTADGRLFEAYAETLRPLIIGIAISAVVGIIVGLWVGLSQFFDWLFSPIFIVMQAAPLAALIPLLVLAYGIGLTSKVIVVCIMGNARDSLEYQRRGEKYPRVLKRNGHILSCFAAVCHISYHHSSGISGHFRGPPPWYIGRVYWGYFSRA